MHEFAKLSLPAVPPFLLDMPQLSVCEMEIIDEVVRVRKGTGSDALNAVDQRRATRQQEPVHESTIYRYLGGQTHQRGRKETRGRKPGLS